MSARIVVSGPSGSGKSAIGAAVAARLGLTFLDADDLHPAQNLARMRAGIPLTDEDRMPWLTLVGERLAQADAGVIACSALARRYRDHLRAHAADLIFIELRTAEEDLAQRLGSREHFFPPALLSSQLAAWEPLAGDERGFAVANDAAIALVADRIVTLIAGWIAVSPCGKPACPGKRSRRRSRLSPRHSWPR